MDNYINVQMGNYRLTKRLGEGGFAYVYLGEHIHIENRKVAIKVLHGSFTEEHIKKLRVEAQTIQRLEHPHIIQLIDFGIATLNEQNIPFFVMDYAPHGPLSKCYSPGTHLPLATIISYVKPIAEALQYAHNQKVIHRDVKPANLLLGKNKEILLSDFGSAVIAHATTSMPKQDITGTAPYMAPEQFIGEPRPASDQYALGIVVYEWLYGEQPFSGPHFMLYAHQHTTTIPISLIQRGVMIPPSIDEIVMKALAKDPKDRFARVQDFADALEKAYREEFATLFNKPEFTAEVLGQEYVQQVLLDMIVAKPDWWEKDGRAKIVTLHEQGKKNSEYTVTIALSQLAEKAESMAIAAIKNEKYEVFKNMLDVIFLATPPSHNSNVWLTLLQDLENKEALAFIAKHKQTRFWLLTQWSNTSLPVNSQLIRPWLIISWSEFRLFFSLHLPDEWSDLALSILLDASPAAPIPTEVMQGFEQHDASLLEELFQRLLQAPKRRSLAVRLFTRLVESGYRKKMHLLYLLLASWINEQQVQQFIEEVLRAARLTGNESIEFLEAYGEQCIRRSPQLSILLGYVRYYLQTLDVENLIGSSHAKTFLYTLSELAQQLPPAIQATVQNWCEISHFVEQPSIAKARLPVLADAISSLSLNTRDSSIKALAKILVSCVESEIDLISIVYEMSPKLKSGTLVLLFSMAEFVGTTSRQENAEVRFIPYIRFVLEMEKVYDITAVDQKRFVQVFLNILLQRIDHSTFKKLKKHITEQLWSPRTSARWEDYIASKATNGYVFSRRTIVGLMVLGVTLVGIGGTTWAFLWKKPSVKSPPQLPVKSPPPQLLVQLPAADAPVITFSPFMAWQGSNKDQSIYWATYDGIKWSTQQRISGIGTTDSPALTSYQGTLYMVWRGVNRGETNDQSIYWTTYDGFRWFTQQRISGIGSVSRPALATVNDKVYMTWRGSNQDQSIYWATYDGIKWSTQQQISGIGTTDFPALAALETSHGKVS